MTITSSAALASLVPNHVVVILPTPVFNAIHAVRGENEARIEHCV